MLTGTEINDWSVPIVLLRLLEGEVLFYKGLGWIVKGYQHPGDAIVAYPRYDLFTGGKLGHHELKWLTEFMKNWDCIKRNVPLVPLAEAVKPIIRMDERVAYLLSTLSKLIKSKGEEIEISGSSILASSNPRDVDVIVYNSTFETVSLLEELLNKGVIGRASEQLVITEYLEKHSSKMSLENYFKLKRDTILHFTLARAHVNVKLVARSRGYNYCVDKVEGYVSYNGFFKILERITAPLIPARYLVKVGGEIMEMESLREVYSELKPGEYYMMGGIIEERRSGRVLVPDHGVVIPK